MDPFLWVVSNTLIIPGVKGEHLFLHVSDNHLSVADSLSTPEERAWAEDGDRRWLAGRESFARSFGEPFGEAQKIGCMECFERLLSYASSERPEALLLTGDTLEAMHPAGERYLARRLKEYGAPFLCASGNHETASCEGVWAPGVRVLECDGFRLAALNDTQKTVSDEDLAALEALAAEGIPMIVLYHIPVAAKGNRGAMLKYGGYYVIDGETADENGRRFVRLLEEADAVKLCLCGHLHTYSKTEIVPGKPQIAASQGLIGFVDRLTVKGTD